MLTAVMAAVLLPAAAHADHFRHGPKTPICFPGDCPPFGYTPPTWRVWPEPVVELPAPLPEPRPGTGPTEQPRELLPMPKEVTPNERGG